MGLGVLWLVSTDLVELRTADMEQQQWIQQHEITKIVKQHTMTSNIKWLMTMMMNATTKEDDKEIQQRWQQKEQH